MNYTYYLILRGHNNTNPYYNKSSINLLIILICAVLVVYMFIFCMKRIGKYRKRPYPFEKIDNITDESSNLLCPICLDNLTDNLVKFKICTHILHKKCAHNFLLHYMNQCPICRKYIYANSNVQNINM